MDDKEILQKAAVNKSCNNCRHNEATNINLDVLYFCAKNSIVLDDPILSCNLYCDKWAGKEP